MLKARYVKQFRLAEAWETVGRAAPFLQSGDVDSALAVLREDGVGPETRYNKLGRRFFEQIQPGHFNAPSLNLEDATRLELLEALFDAGWDVDVQDDLGWSFLHRAVWAESFAAVRFLLERGANPNIRTFDDETPLDFAIQHFRTYHDGPSQASALCLEALILGGADVYLPFSSESNKYRDRFEWISALPEDRSERQTFFAALAKRDAMKQTSQAPETPNA